MKAKQIVAIAALLIALVFSGCSSIKVSYDYNKSVDFSQYKTYEFYGWAKESDQIINQLDRQRIQNAFASEFKSRGMNYVESGGDLVVTLFFVVQEKKGVTYSTNTYGGYYGGYYGYGPGWGWGPTYSTTTAHEYDYKVGTLVCDVYDKKSEQLLWEGIGQKTIDDNPNSHERNIQKAVAQIMWNYPVKPVKPEK